MSDGFCDYSVLDASNGGFTLEIAYHGPYLFSFVEHLKLRSRKDKKLEEHLYFIIVQSHCILKYRKNLTIK